MDHPHLKKGESLMDLTRRAKCAADAGITDPLTAFMAVFHPEVDTRGPEWVKARAQARKEQRR